MRHAASLGLCLLATAAVVAACAMPSPRSGLPRLPRGPSDERPPWLRDLPQPLERYPAPQGWGGDYLARTDRERGTSTARVGTG